MADKKEPAPKGAVCSKYGEVTTTKGSFLPGEPVFILRAKDATAINMLARYQTFLEGMDASRKPSDETLASIAADIAVFAAWQVDNQDRVRVPD